MNQNSTAARIATLAAANGVDIDDAAPHIAHSDGIIYAAGTVSECLEQICAAQVDTDPQTGEPCVFEWQEATPALVQGASGDLDRWEEIDGVACTVEEHEAATVIDAMARGSYSVAIGALQDAGTISIPWDRADSLEREIADMVRHGATIDTSDADHVRLSA